MADILFRCPSCGKSLAVDSRCPGQSVNCTDCGCALVVPDADIEYRCPHCRTKLFSPADLAGAACSCPACDRDLSVPPHASRLSLGRKREADANPAVRRCQGCGSEVAPAAVLCVNCGIDLRTGEPFHGKPKARALNTVWFYWGTVAVVLVAAMGGWHLWNVKQAEKAVRIAQLQARAAQAEREANERAEQQRAEAERVKAEQERRRADAETQRLKAEQARQEAEQARHEAEQRRSRMAALQKSYLDVPEVGLLDALAQLSMRQDYRLSIDPDIIGAVGQIRVKPADLNLLADAGTRNEWLAGRGLIMRSCPISETDSNRVDLLTTAPIWAYSCASRQLRAGQFDAALRSLAAVQADESEFGVHCQSLRALLQSYVARQAEAGELAIKVRRNLASCGSHHKAAQMFMRGAEMASTRESSKRVGDPHVQEAMAKSNYTKALEYIRIVCADIESFKRKAITSSSDLAERFGMAFDANLHTEAKFLLDAYVGNYASLRGLYGEVEKTGLLEDVGAARYYGMESALGRVASDAEQASNDMVDVPEELRRTRAAIDGWVNVSSGQAGVLRLDVADREDIAREMEASGRAFIHDRGNIFARAAEGFYRLRLHGDGMQLLFSGKADAGQGIQALVREFDSRQKGGMLRSAMEVSGQGTHAQLSAAGNDKVGSVSGLCIFGSDSVGEIMQIAVQIVPRTRSTISREVSVRSSAGVVTPYVGYWRNWSASERFVYETISDPIVFEDYGPKDDQMTMSAIEAYRWLSRTFPSNMQDRAVYIAFHHLKEGKRGDSAGAAMALAAFSTIEGCLVRSDVAITGSIRSDGSVLGVGGIFEKIRGAVAAPYVEVIIIPRENEGDAMMVPFDDLCRIAVVSADDMATYMNYATRKDYRQEELTNLRKAQVHLLTGHRDLAEPLLLEVAAGCPENFTARRLLELLAFSKMTGRTGLASAKAP